MSARSTGLEAFKTVVPHLGRVRQTFFEPFILLVAQNKVAY